METSDLLFATVPLAALGQAGREGLDPSATRFHARLEDVEGAAHDTAIVAVDRNMVAGAQHIAPAALLNLSPYHPPRPIRAGGGIVLREDDQASLLAIFRRGVWDLPKGKPDEGEPIEACAIREVREEVGIERIELLGPAGTTLHGYCEGERFLVKRTYWFYMRTPERSFTPQASEGIEAVTWMSWRSAAQRLGHPNLRRHIEALRASPNPIEFSDRQGGS